MNTVNKIIIGRSPDCDIVVNNPIVSRRHAEAILTSDNNIIVNDLNSTNGTYILRSGKTIKCTSPTTLLPSDILLLGKSGKVRIPYSTLFSKLKPQKISVKKPPPPPDSSFKIIKPKARNLERCTYCGAIKKVGQKCPVCGRF